MVNVYVYTTEHFELQMQSDKIHQDPILYSLRFAHIFYVPLKDFHTWTVIVGAY